jgi:hypothetical protein
MPELSQADSGFSPRRGHGLVRLHALCALALNVAACSGQISDPSGAPGEASETSSHGASSSGSSSANGDPKAPGSAASGGSVFVPAPATLRKLTVEQYRNSVQDLLGADLEVPSDLEPDTAQNGFIAIAAARATVSPAAAEKYENAAYALAAQALTPARRAAFVGCTPKASIDTACSTQFVAKLGKRAFRRPLSAAETTRYVTVAENAARTLNDFHAGLEFAIAGILQSPNFLFRVELGEPDPSDPSRLRYSNYELASRLSYTLWNTTPDSTLLDAAERGELSSSAGLTREAERLVADARVKPALDNFHAERLGLADLAQLSKADSVYKGLDDALRAALRDDVLMTIADQTSGAGRDFQALFDTPVAFVNRALAGIYGVTASSDGMQKMSLPSSAKRTGLLGKAAFLALNAHTNETSPTLRGKYIRERFLCQSIGAPPPNVVPVLGPVDPNAPTMRDRLKAHATDAVCGACHNQMDPLGLALEHFDAIGRYRDNDQGHALDTTGSLDGAAFDGGIELAKLLRDDPRSAACVVRQLYRYAVAHVEGDGEKAQIDGLVAQFENSGHDFSGLLRAVVQSDGFLYAAKVP